MLLRLLKSIIGCLLLLIGIREDVFEFGVREVEEEEVLMKWVLAHCNGIALQKRMELFRKTMFASQKTKVVCGETKYLFRSTKVVFQTMRGVPHTLGGFLRKM